MTQTPEWIDHAPIKGISFKRLETHTDPRGFFREIIRVTDPFFSDTRFAQWSHSFMRDGVIKAWHFHRIQTDFFYVATGIIRVGLHDIRPESDSHGKTMDFHMGDGQAPLVLKIPPGVAHGVKAIQGSANLMYLMSHTYNPDDEVRIPQDDPGIGFDWNAN